jgi:hypothetical protein
LCNRISLARIIILFEIALDHLITIVLQSQKLSTVSRRWIIRRYLIRHSAWSLRASPLVIILKLMLRTLITFFPLRKMLILVFMVAFIIFFSYHWSLMFVTINRIIVISKIFGFCTWNFDIWWQKINNLALLELRKKKLIKISAWKTLIFSSKLMFYRLEAQVYLVLLIYLERVTKNI